MAQMSCVMGLEKGPLNQRANGAVKQRARVYVMGLEKGPLNQRMVRPCYFNGKHYVSWVLEKAP